jgi:polysaccharide biosynthesis PFTS motif protein
MGQRGTLISKKDSNIILCQIGWLNLPVLLVMLLRNQLNSIHYLAAPDMILSILRLFINPENLKQILPIGHISTAHYGEALDIVDDVYSNGFEDKIPINWVNQLINHSSMVHVIKKELSSELATSLYMLALSENLQKGGKQSILIDFKFQKYQPLADAASKKAIRIGDGMLFWLDEFSVRIQVLRNRIMLFGLVPLLFFQSLFNIFKRRKARSFKYAVLVHNAKHQFKANGKYFDFIIDEDLIKQDDVVFLQMDGISPDNISVNSARGRHFSPHLTYRYVLQSSQSKDLLHLLISILPIVMKNFWMPNHQSLARAIQTLLMNVIRWRLILEQYTFDHLITFNDEQSSHIIRNDVLKQRGTQSWYYAHSAAMGYSSNSLENPREVRHILWSYLSYDHYVTWNVAMKSYILSHPVFFQKVHMVGCLWSQFIHDEKTKRDHALIAAFDTSYINNIREGISFYEDLLDYINSRERISIIFKPKKDFSDYKPGRNFFGSEDYKLFSILQERLEANPNVTIYPPTEDAYELMSRADIVVTHAISSSSIEAIAAGKRALFYDPGDRYAGSHYDQIDGLICSTKTELGNELDRILKLDQQKYRATIQSTYPGVIDGFMDGRGVQRFCKLLAETPV